MAEKIKVKKVEQLLAECDLAEADLAGDIRRRQGKGTRTKFTKAKPTGSWIKFDHNANSGDSHLEVNKMRTSEVVQELAKAGINLIRADYEQKGDDDIHEPLTQFINLVSEEAERIHRQWHDDPKNKRKGH